MAYDKVVLYGGQTCDYLYIQKNAIEDGEFNYVDDEPSDWKDNNTILYANFNDKEKPLVAGNSKVIGSIVGYEIFRQKYDESYAEYVCTVQKAKEGLGGLLVDYSVKNGVDYTYYLYPNSETSESGSVLTPFKTKQLAIDSSCWSLLIVDETEEDNVFYLDKMFNFEFNLQIDDMSNNAQFSVTQNFTKYPTIQRGNSNYWSGSLSALCGFLSSDDVDYIQTVNMINELKSITSDTRRKFLKDTDGNLWEVDISAPLNISTERVSLRQLKTLKFSWVEVGDTKGVSIINNPKKATTDWVLTETGMAVPYYTYKWGEQYKWNNSYMWTANDVVNINVSNLGREISDLGGDE